MSTILMDLLFWIVVFVVFVYGFKWLQRRKKGKQTDQSKTDH